MTERLGPPRGEVIAPLNEEEVRDAARELKKEGVESIAVCFLFSYIDQCCGRWWRPIWMMSR